MNDAYVTATFVICIFILAGCASIVPSTHHLKEPLQKSSFNAYNPLSSPLSLPYLEELRDITKSGAMLISDGSYALLHRATLARMAKYSIEIQTYIYKNDIASQVLMHEIWQAANRGVQIKILVDDNGLDSDYSDIIALNNHPNIEVRIFNPYRNRIKLFRLSEMVLDIKRVNRRMHNKMFIVDGIALIVGGRNIADNYFDNTLGVNFSDTDAFFLGQVAKEAQESFKEYWEYHRSIPVEFLPSKRKMKKFLKNYSKVIQELESDTGEWQKYHDVMQVFIDNYQHKKNKIYWGNGVLVADSPEKIDAKNPTSKILAQLTKILENVTDSVYISSAYFVPGKKGFEGIKESMQKGINYFILTNSLSSTDVLAVYSAWERYRDKLVKINANIYEYRKSEGTIKIRGKVSSGASLHSKIFVFDNKISCVGSFNLDPRSSVINTEVVAIFDNEEFAKEMTKLIQIDMQKAWKLKRINNKTTWCAYDDESDNKTLCFTHSPDTSWWVRFVSVLAKIMPENQM